MIADFFSIKEKLNKRADNILKAEADRRMSPLVRSIDTHFQHEGTNASVQTIDNQVQELEYKAVGTHFSLTAENINKMSYDDVVDWIKKTAADFAAEVSRFAFGRINSILEEAGRVSYSTEGFTPNTLLDALEGTEIDFDDTRDRPIIPTTILHPATYRKLKDMESRMTDQERESHHRRQEEILDRKYEQYLSRENNRRLVD